MELSKPLRVSNIIVQEAGTELVLSSIEGKAIHVLNPTARFIWNLCDGQHTLEAIEQSVRASFAVSENHDVRGDIQRTLKELADKGMLEVD